MPRGYNYTSRRTVSSGSGGAVRPAIKKAANAVFGGVKSYGKNVAGGAKILGGALKNVAKWPGKQIEKEWRGEDAHIEGFRKKMKDKGWNR